MYSDNIIFCDTEFTDLDIRVGELISIGLVKYSGEELYVELDFNGPVHPWVEEKVLPSLKNKKIGHESARKKIEKFVGESVPYLMSYVNQFDAVYWYQLFGSPKKHPAYWIPLDFASILFAHGYSPNSLGKKKFFEKLNINKDKYDTHNALDDAKMLRDIYKKFVRII